ncbi:MAG: amidohydrolase family protein [Chitinivibrionales bacterium]
MSTVYFARWILLDDGTVLANGGLTVENDTITSVGTRSKLKRRSGDRVVNLGEILLLPGLINIHSHLEQAIVRDIPREPDESFACWTAKKQSRIRQAQPDAIKSSVRLGILEALANGITTIVDSTRTDIPAQVLQEEPIRSWVMHEIHADDADSEQDIELKTDRRLKGTSRKVGAGCGPYALYSLSPAAQRALNEYIKENRLIWASHTAESSEELQAFTEQKGDLFFQISRKKPWPFGKTELGSMHYAISQNLIPNKGICYHCNYVSGQELALLAAKNVSIVHCPNYNRLLGHKPFPVDVARNRGINLCIGTESAAAAAPLSLFDELHTLKQDYPHIPAAELISWVTQNPAKALRCADRIGSLTPGKKADLIGVRFSHSPRADLLEELLEEQPEIVFVTINGEEIIVGC